ncbi:HNH endonuclease signature motif containing protein [Nocardioides mesophilus]|uniref:DUF222 domain-containing protein n=1 Tax=Nocardioides mesophilus TaxID=433659 RepID=A0A7G9REI3_9ACTN|nr:HNH endonuclease signature motif containing protein [Nocardioides mesophilus]QNN54008.1 DUF222 domain-containing protein [Nocardioides mesophilus]
MSVHALHEPELTGWVGEAREATIAAAGVPLGRVGDDELAAALHDVVQLESRLRAFRLSLLHEADCRKLAEETAASGTAAWAAKLTGTTRGVMSGGLWLVRVLNERYNLTRDAFAAGSINEKQVRVIVNAAEDMPEGVSQEDREAAEAGLVELAVDGTNARALRQRARRMLDRISRELADKQESGMLEKEEERAEGETWLTLSDRGDGTFVGKFVIPELQGRMLQNFLERLTSPRRLSRNKAGEEIEDDSVGGTFNGLNWSETLGMGFLELIEHLPEDGWSGVNASLVVTIDLQHLRDGLAAAHLDTGVSVSAGQARRLACEAGLIPAVLGGRSEVLDLGRSMRLANLAIRRAIHLIYDTCAAEGCDRPVAWSEIHHLEPWSEGGVTSLENSVPLCGHHHRRAHDCCYELIRLDTGELRFRYRRRPRSSPPT